MFLSRSSWLSMKFIGYLLLGLNVSTILTLFLKGLPLFIGGMKPPDIVLIITFLYFMLEYYGEVDIAGERFTDSFFIGCTLICIASVLPVGVFSIYENGFKIRILGFWLIMSLIFTFLGKFMHWANKEDL